MQTAIYKLKVGDLNKDFIHDLQDDHGASADLEIKVYPPGQNPRMTEDDFWKIINLIDWEQKGNDAMVEPVINALIQLPIRQMYSFQDILAEKLFWLDGKKYALNIGRASFSEKQPFSVDHFLDVRLCVVANGQEYYEWVLNHPEDMPKDTYFETLLYVVPKAWKRKTGKEFSYLPAFDYHTYSNINAWEN